MRSLVGNGDRLAAELVPLAIDSEAERKGRRAETDQHPGVPPRLEMSLKSEPLGYVTPPNDAESRGTAPRSAPREARRSRPA